MDNHQAIRHVYVRITVSPPSSQLKETAQTAHHPG